MLTLISESDDDIIVTSVDKPKEDPDAVIFIASSKVKKNRKGNTALLLTVPSKGNTALLLSGLQKIAQPSKA